MKKAKNSAKSKQLLNQYLNAETSAEDEQKVIRWYFSFTKADELPLSEAEQQRLLQAAKKKILSTTQQESKKIFKFNSTYLKVAALLFMLCSVTFFAVKNSIQRKSLLLASNEFSTKAGERKVITLMDGSKVWLNNASVLHYPSRFGNKTREVTLEGEGFFEVVHKPTQPFLIHVNGLKVQVLGTSFNVRAYAADKKISVTVASGAVSVSNPENKILLRKGEGVIYHPGNTVFTKIAAHIAHSRAWQTNTLYFRYETLLAITQSLERWYGVKFEIRNKKLLQEKYTLEQHDETLENVMKVLCAGEFNYKIEGKTVIIW